MTLLLLAWAGVTSSSRSAPAQTRAVVKAGAEKGLALAQARDLKTLGWLLLADVYNRRREPEKMNEALRHAKGLS